MREKWNGEQFLREGGIGGASEVGSHVRIDDFVTISGKVVLGNYIHIAQFCGLYGGTEGICMEDFSGLSSKCTIYATSNDYSGASLTNPTVPAKYKTADKNAAVRLGRHAIIGCMSVILPGVTIGEGCAVGAMSLCLKYLDPWGVYIYGRHSAQENPEAQREIAGVGEAAFGRTGRNDKLKFLSWKWRCFFQKDEKTYKFLHCST